MKQIADDTKVKVDRFNTILSFSRVSFCAFQSINWKNSTSTSSILFAFYCFDFPKSQKISS